MRQVQRSCHNESCGMSCREISAGLAGEPVTAGPRSVRRCGRTSQREALRVCCMAQVYQINSYTMQRPELAPSHWVVRCFREMTGLTTVAGKHPRG